jgi:phage/plasmid primase-like uncharacterized protein
VQKIISPEENHKPGVFEGDSCGAHLYSENAPRNIVELFPGRERSDIELAEMYARMLLDERDAEIASIRASIERLREPLQRMLDAALWRTNPQEALRKFNEVLATREAATFIRAHPGNGFHDAEQQFREAAAQRGLIIGRLIADGQVHRCDVEGKRGKGDGAYLLRIDGDIPPWGWFENHRDGMGWQTWQANGGGRPWTEAEKAAYKKRIEAERAKREKERIKRQAAAQERAAAIVIAATEPPADHPYFVSKQIKPPHGVLYSADPVAISGWRDTEPDVLIVPMRDIDGTLWSVQFIDGAGNKDFLAGGRKAGTFFVISADGKLDPSGLNLPCEGVATGASCFEAKSAPAICAFDADNLSPVVTALRKRYLEIGLLLCGDDDWRTIINGKLVNTGRIKAMEAAKAAGIKAVFPVFDPDRERHDKWTDFNDLHQAEGLDAVRRCLEVETLKWPSKEPRMVGSYADFTGGIAYAYVKKGKGAKPDETVTIPVANFAARIIGQVAFDDGAEIERRFEIEAYLAGRYRRFAIETSELGRADAWALREIGAKAIITAGKMGGAGYKEHLREAIQQLSPPVVPQRTIYGHTGWRTIDGQKVYLHAGGGIGADGVVEGIKTDLSGHGLSLVLLPPPPLGEELRAAIRSSLALLDLGPHHVIAPQYGAIWRATFGDVDFSMSPIGKTGVFKTQIASLVQQHWGAGFVATKLPGTWQSTGNSLEAQAYAAKDMVFVIDDFAPGGSPSEISRTHKEAARIYRAQGNLAGRGRLNANASQRPPKAPRGLILSTGEDLPHGESVRARTFALEVRAGDIAPAALTTAQEAGGRGNYALAMSGWLRWLAATPAAWTKFRKERKELRSKMTGGHARTAWMTGDLLAALQVFLDFAVEAEAITQQEAHRRFEQCKEGILHGTAEQQEHMQEQNPADRFIQLIGAALVTGRAHLASTEDGASEPVKQQGEWGWSRENFSVGGVQSTAMKPAGQLIGWTEEATKGVVLTVWLEPTAAYNLAYKMTTEQGMPFAVTPPTMWQRLKEAGKLAQFDTEKRGGKDIERCTHSKKVNGTNRHYS